MPACEPKKTVGEPPVAETMDDRPVDAHRGLARSSVSARIGLARWCLIHLIAEALLMCFTSHCQIPVVKHEAYNCPRREGRDVERRTVSGNEDVWSRGVPTYPAQRCGQGPRGS